MVIATLLLLTMVVTMVMLMLMLRMVVMAYCWKSMESMSSVVWSGRFCTNSSLLGGLGLGWGGAAGPVAPPPGAA